MDWLVLGFGALIFVCLAAGCNFFATAKMQDNIHAAKQARRSLNTEVSELQAALISKREEKKIVISKLRMARAESVSQKEVIRDIRPKTPSGESGQFEHELVSQKVITARELDRVKKYRKSTSCPYGVAETIVMLGYASQHDIDRLKEKYPQ